MTVRRIRLERGAVEANVLSAVQQREILEAELAKAVLGSAFSRRSNRSRLIPAMREALVTGPRTGVTWCFSATVNEPWVGTGLDVLLLGELPGPGSAGQDLLRRYAAAGGR
ncbi:hypothetical protein [Kitasatospora aureofaciens]|uniref:hypothetical protein n=1 Tax=Kitasatospora aureofaciens TaxID=1894 RepID=UPI0033EB5734